MPTKGPIAVVTGASGGVGSALCAALAARGLSVVGLGRDPERLRACQAQAPADISCLTVDLALASERERVVAHFTRSGPIRYLIHAAAVIEPVLRAELLREEQWQAAQALNVEAPLFLSLRLAPLLTGGRILHLSSGAAHQPVAGCLAYCATKAAFHMIYRVLQLELAQHAILVGSASPGSVDTSMQAKLRTASATDLPEGARFRQLEADKRLVSTACAARFLTWLLLESEDALFTERDWNIQDDALSPLWDA